MKSRDCLNTFRLLAATQVLYGHAVHHLSIDGIPVIISSFINFFSGVPVFFTLSGYLIWGSVYRSNSYGLYLKKRFWRIYPELWFAVAVELLVLIVLYDNPINWQELGLFAVTQSTVFQFWTPVSLRGYGCGVPNGALWTIGVLIQFYFCAYYIYKYLHGKKTVVWIILIVLTIIIAFFTPFLQSNVSVVMGNLYGVTIFPYLWMFLVSSFMAEKKEQLLPYLKKYWYVVILLTIVIDCYDLDIVLGLYTFIGTILLFGGIIGVSYKFPSLNIRTDISYGVYIYHFTVINALIEFDLTKSQWLLLLVVFVSFVLAWISTKTIGKWSSSMKSRICLQEQTTSVDFQSKEFLQKV